MVDRTLAAAPLPVLGLLQPIAVYLAQLLQPLKVSLYLALGRALEEKVGLAGPSRCCWQRRKVVLYWPPFWYLSPRI